MKIFIHYKINSLIEAFDEEEKVLASTKIAVKNRFNFKTRVGRNQILIIEAVASAIKARLEFYRSQVIFLDLNLKKLQAHSDSGGQTNTDVNIYNSVLESLGQVEVALNNIRSEIEEMQKII